MEARSAEDDQFDIGGSTDLDNNNLDSEPNNVLVVNTVDGLLHGISTDKHGKRSKMWSLSSGGPMMTSMSRSGEEAMSSYSVLPSVDGSLLVHHHNSNGLRKTSVTARMLAEKTSFVNEDGLVFSGSKRSRLMGVDVSSGSMFHDSDTADTAGISGGSLPFSSADDEDALDPDNFDGERSVVTDTFSPMWIGRTDYTVRAFDSKTGQEAFNLSYSEVRPVGGRQRGLGQRGNYIETQDEVKGPMIISNVEGDLLVAHSAVVNNQESIVVSEIALGSPAASAFTVSGGVVDENGEGDNGYEVEMQRVVHRMRRPRATSLATSSSQVLDDVLQDLLVLPAAAQARAIIVKSLVRDGVYVIPLDEDTGGRPEVTEVSRKLTLGEQLLRLTGISLVAAPVQLPRIDSQSQLLLDYSPPMEGEYDLLPAPAHPQYDPVLGDFTKAGGYGDTGGGYAEHDDEYVGLESAKKRPLSAFLLLSDLIRAIETLLLTVGILAVVAYSGLVVIRRMVTASPTYSRAHTYHIHRVGCASSEGS
jgi:hypothetical protein